MELKNALFARTQFIKEVLSGLAKSVIFQFIWDALKSGSVNSIQDKRVMMLKIETTTIMKRIKSKIKMQVDLEWMKRNLMRLLMMPKKVRLDKLPKQ